MLWGVSLCHGNCSLKFVCRLVQLGYRLEFLIMCKDKERILRCGRMRHTFEDLDVILFENYYKDGEYISEQ